MKNLKTKLYYAAAILFLLGLMASVTMSLNDPFPSVSSMLMAQQTGSGGGGGGISSSSCSPGNSCDKKKQPTSMDCKQTKLQEVSNNYQAQAGQQVRLGSQISGGFEANTGVYNANFQAQASGEYTTFDNAGANANKKYLVQSETSFSANGTICKPDGSDDCTPYNPCTTIFP